MGAKNSREAKKEKRIINFLRAFTIDYNKPKQRMVAGKLLPYKNEAIDFLGLYRNGKIIVNELPRKNGQRTYEIKELGNKNSPANDGVGDDNSRDPDRVNEQGK